MAGQTQSSAAAQLYQASAWPVGLVAARVEPASEIVILSPLNLCRQREFTAISDL